MPSTHFGSLPAYQSRPNTEARSGAKPFVSIMPAVRRGPPNPRDISLSSFARTWAETLPEALRPEFLCDRYPRIANRLALCWADPALTDRFFKGLLADERGGRTGFPREVADELARLRADAASRRQRAGH